jgi:hypothetical protein
MLQAGMNTEEIRGKMPMAGVVKSFTDYLNQEVSQTVSKVDDLLQ